ncbi:MAG: c-type cytochrome [Anaerolineales bacterium]|nr:c-type cytochrome [Anaerolineales bacterium]MCX7609933.1 c-type cytochrome [Anaerolineales bacterium]MDW8227241.1 c-type cytochrome [Anaerolineales bacterium]
MKRANLLLLIFTILFLAGCSFSLAEDITPPPDYATPTPMPDIGELHPAQPPSPAQGEALFAEKCAPCHGEQGLGNGPMAGNLPVAVPAIGLADISRKAIPADWYKIVSMGNLQRGMPPFLSLSPQERWNVIAYTLMLSMPVEEIETGKALFEANCATCHRTGGVAEKVNFTDQVYMSQMSNLALYQATARGKGQMPAFEGRLSEQEIWSIVSYLRSLSFDLNRPTAQAATPEPMQETPVPPEATPTEVPEEATPSTTGLAVQGRVENRSNASLPQDLKVTLYLYDLSTNQIAERWEQTVASDGSFRFTDIRTFPSAGYWVEAEYQGVFYISPFAEYDGSPSLDLSLPVYEVTKDWSSLKQEALHIFLDFSSPDLVRVEEFYVFYNLGTQAILLPTDGTSLPLIRLPADAASVQIAPSEESANFLPAQEGIALPPTSDAFGVVVSFTLPYERNMTFSQPLVLPVSSVTLITAAGTRVKSDQLQDKGQQDFSGQTYQIYQANNLSAGDLTFRLIAPSRIQIPIGNVQPWLIGMGALGVVFILLGAFLFWRDRLNQPSEEESASSEDQSEDTEAILDAIIALDEQFRRGELERSVYEKRRAILKEQVREALSRRK